MALLPTKHAPAERADPASILADHELVLRQSALIDFISGVSTLVAVLNTERQMVWASDDFVKFRGLDNFSQLLGKRPGEAVRCINSGREAGGCGTSENCTVCGAVHSILTSRERQTRVTEYFRLTVREAEGLRNYDFEVTSTPWNLEGRQFTLFTLRDVGAEKRKVSLEKIFFHDIVNSVGGLSGLLEVLVDFADLNEAKDLVDLSQRTSHDVLEEILSFRQLKQAETGELQLEFGDLSAETILAEVAGKIRFHSVGAERGLVVQPVDSGLLVRADRLLLERVLVNMAKNALEATAEGAVVNLGCRQVEHGVCFWVRNPGTMPREVQLQVFQRSFSTKGPERGLGTYSMKLIGEKYLKGKVDFTSGEGLTEFTITLP